MNRIAELRKEKHLTQIGLALKLNISQYMVCAYETGRTQLTADMLINIANFFNVSVDYLIGNSNIRCTADTIAENNFTENELKLLDMLRAMPNDKQQQAIGVLFALNNI